MKLLRIKSISRVKADISLPGDKSIAHRALILSALSAGKTVLKNVPLNRDCQATIEILKQLGIKILSPSKERIFVYGNGLGGLKQASGALYISESGTTFRLFLGLLAGQVFSTTLSAGKSLSQRPMLRVTRPLRLMGANISARVNSLTLKEEYPPVEITGSKLKGIIYKIPVASAQVKSAILLAALYAQGRTVIVEPVKTRDHTERMLVLFKAGLKTAGNKVMITPGVKLVSPKNIAVPGDISSAGFFLVLALILPDSSIRIKNVGLNPTRTGIIKVLKRMGADITVSKSAAKGRGAGITRNFEPAGDLIVKSGKLKGAIVTSGEIPSLIDELPALMVAASFAGGRTIFKGVGELRVKETDRIRAMSENLKKMGSDIKVVKNGRSEDVVITGGGKLKAASVKSFNDHRTAMSMVVAGLAASGTTVIDDVSCIDKSFPGFINFVKKAVIQ